MTHHHSVWLSHPELYLGTRSRNLVAALNLSIFLGKLLLSQNISGLIDYSWIFKVLNVASSNM
jgi:hypothetical protein